MPVAEILAGIALVKSSVEFIKSNIDTCKDIGELGSAIDSLLRGKDEVNKKQGRGPSVREQFDTSHIARETIDAKLAAEQLQEIASMIDFRFGHGTWRGILEERARRIQKAKEQRELMETLKIFFITIGVIVVGGAIVVASIYYSRLG